MNILSGGPSDFFGLDMGMSAVRVVQLKGNGPVKALGAYGQAPFAGNLALSDSKEDRNKVAQTIQQLIKQLGITTKNVAVNVPSGKVFTTVIDMEKMPPEDLAKAIKYQADTYIPTAAAASKVDWSVLGDSLKEAGKTEVLISSVENAFIEARLDMVESLGLNVLAFEPDSMAVTRAMIPADSNSPQMILDIGRAGADIIVAMNGAPHLSRFIPVGFQALVVATTQAMNIDAAQADQFIRKFGISKDKLDGQLYNAIIVSVETLMTEIEKTIKFFQTRYPNTKLEKITVTGWASTLPELPLYIANKFNMNVEIGNAWRNVSFPASEQNKLLAVSNSFGVVAGLAERDL
jgi:type IV pilus assembly protein PilM